MSDTNESAGPLAGQVALVTGASRGIGRAIAESLARDGARVACVATRVENAEATAAACSALTGGAAAYGVDVSNHEAVAALVKEIGKEFGGIDVLVNNAGITRDQLLLRMGEDDFDRVIDVNL
ncbi:MAG: SDR family NAD(P)-dependent oxidoreductase, partial [Planctomycetota bacterium]|nr:SDR family NAD(P)-dependent oxidoreductase [Planctomycetota bacterium]